MTRPGDLSQIGNSGTRRRSFDKGLAQIDFISGDRHLEIIDVWIEFSLPIGLDHRCARYGVRYPLFRPQVRHSRNSLERWKPYTDDNGQPEVFQDATRNHNHRAKYHDISVLALEQVLAHACLQGSVVRFCAIAGMTPDPPIQKTQLRSPLHKMDGEEAHDDDELVGTPKSTSESAGPSLDAIAAIMRQDLHTAISPLESQLTPMGVTFEERMGKIENTMADQDVRLSRLEQSMAADPPDTTPLPHFAEEFAGLIPNRCYQRDTPFQ